MYTKFPISRWNVDQKLKSFNLKALPNDLLRLWQPGLVFSPSILPGVEELVGSQVLLLVDVSVKFGPTGNFFAPHHNLMERSKAGRPINLPWA